jgi:hypothetical protein
MRQPYEQRGTLAPVHEPVVDIDHPVVNLWTKALPRLHA